MLVLTVILQAAYAAAISKVGAALAASISLLGASYGISKIGVTALEAIARQPEAAGDVRSNLIVAAALIEGVAFFAIVVCLLVLFL
jgi:F-type H+-transporting ATPase subunit c